MLKNLNPSFVLDLTATPRSNSNIISYTDARELKKENMVKLPVIVYNHNLRKNVLEDAIQLRELLEYQANKEEQTTGIYIRPIGLFQTQPNIKEDSETFGKIKNMLIINGIPSQYIAIKTSQINELDKVDLLSRDCPIRYIITVNALKEGWDCPFAYILASLANKSSNVEVEQIVGRILRQPYTRQYTEPLLNTSYVLTCSADFSNVLDNVVLGLNNSGFSEKDCRVAEETPIPSNIKLQQCSLIDLIPGKSAKTTPVQEKTPDEDEPLEKTKLNLHNKQHNTSMETLTKQAKKQTEDYNKKLVQDNPLSDTATELLSMKNNFPIQELFQNSVQQLCLPQFYIEGRPNLFSGKYSLLHEENLTDGFSLKEKDAEIDFHLSTGDIYTIDLSDQGEAIPKYKKAKAIEAEYLKQQIARFPAMDRKKYCAHVLTESIGKNDRYANREIKDYVLRVIAHMKQDELDAMESNLIFYGNRIKEKIWNLEIEHREKTFYNWLNTGKIVCRESWKFPDFISPMEYKKAMSLSLYEAEKNDLNTFEWKLINNIISQDNILFWHRVIEKKGFCINGFLTNYPDFVVMTKAGNILLIEAKGDFLDGENSRKKLRLGRSWQSLAGSNYRYFMVFESKNLELDGAYNLESFISILKEL